MPLVTQMDVEKQITDYLAALKATVSEISSYSVGTRVEPGVTPVNAMRVRLVGGVSEGRTHARPRVDFRFWGDGTAKGEAAVKAAARKVLAHLERDFRLSVFAEPVPLPDPADASRIHVLFTIELLTRGVQS